MAKECTVPECLNMTRRPDGVCYEHADGGTPEPVLQDTEGKQRRSFRRRTPEQRTAPVPAAAAPRPAQSNTWSRTAALLDELDPLYSVRRRTGAAIEAVPYSEAVRTADASGDKRAAAALVRRAVAHRFSGAVVSDPVRRSASGGARYDVTVTGPTNETVDVSYDTSPLHRHALRCGSGRVSVDQADLVLFGR